MKVKINQNGYLASPYISDAKIDIEVDNETYIKIASCPNDSNWKYENGEFIKVKLVDMNVDISFKQELLRSRREYECFPYINRGELWYDLLTDAQKEELDVWYKDWLNVTETLIVPTKPKWLK